MVSSLSRMSGASRIFFTMLRVLPGDVAYMLLSGGGGGVAVTEESLNALRDQLGLMDPLPIQYVKWLWDTARLDLGSLSSQEILCRLRSSGVCL